MYNRYIPGTNGHYERQIVSPPQPERPPAPLPEQPISKPCASADPPAQGPDMGDLLLLCVLLLLLLDSDGEDMGTLLLTAAAFVFLQ